MAETSTIFPYDNLDSAKQDDHPSSTSSTLPDHSNDARVLMNFVLVILMIFLIPHMVLILVKILRKLFPSLMPRDPWEWQDLSWLTKERYTMEKQLQEFVTRRNASYSMPLASEFICNATNKPQPADCTSISEPDDSPRMTNIEYNVEEGLEMGLEIVEENRGLTDARTLFYIPFPGVPRLDALATKKTDTVCPKMSEIDSTGSSCNNVVDFQNDIPKLKSCSIQRHDSGKSNDSTLCSEHDEEEELGCHNDPLHLETKADDTLCYTLNVNGCKDNENSQNNGSSIRHSSKFRLVSDNCAICLSELEKGDEISWSSNKDCPHVFHRGCICSWLGTLRLTHGIVPEAVIGCQETAQFVEHQMSCPVCRLCFIDVSDIVAVISGDRSVPEDAIMTSSRTRA